MPRGMSYSYGLLPQELPLLSSTQQKLGWRLLLFDDYSAPWLLPFCCIRIAFAGRRLLFLPMAVAKMLTTFCMVEFFTPLQPSPSTALPVFSFCRREIALEISSLRNEWLLGTGALPGPKVFAVFSSHPFAQLSWFQYYCVINKGVVWPLGEKVGEGGGGV